MSLNALSRYDDAEDEIRDEDHNLVLKTADDEPIQQSPDSNLLSRPSSRPPSELEKPKSLVSYIGEYSDEDTGSDDDANKDNDTPASKNSVVNLGLYDGTAVLSSTGSNSPSSLNDNLENMELLKESRDTVQLPPEPEGRCSKSVQEKIARMIEKKNSGMNVNDYIQRKKEFRNPSIYEKLVNFVEIDEHGTNFPKHLYDPNIWGPESYYDALAKAQKEHHDKKEKEKLKRTHVEFVTGTKKAVAQAPNAATSAEKKSKWDLKVPPAVQAAIKSNEKQVK